MQTEPPLKSLKLEKQQTLPTSPFLMPTFFFTDCSPKHQKAKLSVTPVPVPLLSTAQGGGFLSPAARKRYPGPCQFTAAAGERLEVGRES